ncbi:hypothetical protein GCM10020331_002160 [Ectobacillus funiculus]
MLSNIKMVKQTIFIKNRKGNGCEEGITCRDSIFLLIFGLFNVAPMSKAFALSYDGSNPVSTGCANDAVTKSYSYISDSHDNVYGKVELKWSAKCKTSWGKNNALSCRSVR